jgi:transposase-like protein
LFANEGAKFWLSELQNQTMKNILIACVDDLKGSPDAINIAFPETQVQLCILHMVCNSMKFVPWKEYKGVTDRRNPHCCYSLICQTWVDNVMKQDKGASATNMHVILSFTKNATMIF